MELIETTISGTTVSMHYADNTDPEQATQWIEFSVPIASLRATSGSDLGEIDGYYVAQVREAALRYVRDIITAETQRLSTFAGRLP